jgi:hypothetical protein
MQTGLHAVNWSLQRLGIGLAMILGLVSCLLLVTGIVIGQGAAAVFGHWPATELGIHWLIGLVMFAAILGRLRCFLGWLRTVSRAYARAPRAS